MVVDFHVVKTELNRLSALLDHKMLNDVPELGGVNPTAENIAAFFFNGLKKAVKLKPSSVKVFETDDSWASYSE
jgi:6-pyruvoyltetrahydropterin/6-carboxytetrahydropterin synthase